MKKILLSLSGVCLALGVHIGSAQAHADHGKPQYGGVVAEAGMAQFEVVSKDGKITVYASHHGSPLSTQGASGKLTVLSGGQKSEIPLQASSGNQLTGTGSLSSGAKLLVLIQLPGQSPLQARLVMP